MKLEEQISDEAQVICDLIDRENKDDDNIEVVIRLLVCTPLAWALRDPDGQTLLEAMENVLGDCVINDVKVMDMLKNN